MKTWKTDISTVYWSDNQNNCTEAELCLGAEKPHIVSWFDELFKGGLKVSYENFPTTLLIKGPPGSGKTTFALELCYRLAKNHVATSTYVSLEAKSDQIIKNAVILGWQKNVMSKIRVITNNKNKDEFEAKKACLNVCGAEYTTKWSENLTDESLNEKTDNVNIAFESIADICHLPYSSSIKNKIKRFFVKKELENIPPTVSQILVIDSLNIFPIESRKEVFLKFLNIAKASQENTDNNANKEKILLMIFVLDAKSNEDCNPFWEYMCDTVIELDHYEENNYFIRTIEIIKSRFQGHILGKHQMKIYDKPLLYKNENRYTLSRLHPFIKEGGIFIFPSVHFYLSKYRKFMQSGELKYDTTFPHSFSKFLSIDGSHKGKGFPKGRCTALIGCRGGHKSHLGYLHILSRLTGKYENGVAEARKNAALIISLRDDEEMIKTTFNGILNNEFSSTNENWKTEDFIDDGRLEFLYYPPGYISPEEFIHRIFVSIHKLKQNYKNVTVLFNSLDQLAARFPLCAKFDIFIPSIIQILIGESITSIFIAVDEKDQPVEQYGLLPMADLILSFHKYQLEQQEYYNILKSDDFAYDEFGKYKYDKSELEQFNPQNVNQKNEQAGENNSNVQREEVIITVERFAGGKKAGEKGLLELGSKCLINKNNIINFVKLPGIVYLDKNRLKK